MSLHNLFANMQYSTSFPVGSDADQPFGMFNTGGTGFLFGYGDTVPTNGAAGWSKGAIFIDTNAATGSLLLVNVGTITSANFDATDVSTLIADLASNANGKGASTIGIEDVGTFTATTEVEAALAELYQHLFSVQASDQPSGSVLKRGYPQGPPWPLPRCTRWSGWCRKYPRLLCRLRQRTYPR